MKGKKILAGALSAAMLLSTMSFTVFAEELGNIGTEEPTINLMETKNTTVTEENAVAQVGDVYYDDFKTALESAQTGDTVTLLKDVEIDSLEYSNYELDHKIKADVYAKINGDITIDLNNHSVKFSDGFKQNATSGKSYVMFLVENDANVIVKGNGKVNAYISDTINGRAFHTLYGVNLTIENGDFRACEYVLYNMGYTSRININGGTFGFPEECNTKHRLYYKSLLCCLHDYKNINVNGGTIVGFEPRHNASIVISDEYGVQKKDDNYAVIPADTVQRTVSSNVAYPDNGNLVPMVYSCTSEEEAKELAKELLGENYVEVMANGKPRYCASYKAAFETAVNGDEIKLLNVAEFDEEVVIDKNITIDFNNKKVTVNSNWDKNTYPTLFRVYSNVTVKNGNMDTSTTSNQGAFCFMVGRLIDNKVKSGSLVIENGTYKAYNTVAQASYGTVEVLGGDFSITPWIQNEETENYEFMFNCLDTPYKNGECGIKIKGGTFAKFDPSNNAAEGKGTDFVVSGYKSLDNGDDTYTVSKTNGDVINTASASGFDVTLDNLHKNDSIKMDDDAIYRVVVSEVKNNDKPVVDEIAKDEEGKDIIAYDITVTKTVNGETTEEVNVTNQQVTLTLPTAVSDPNSVKLYHIENGVKKEITNFTLSADGKTITFTADSFSAYVIAYNAAAVAETEVTPKINVEFEKVTDVVDNEYNIVLKADNDKKINGLMTADLTFELTQGTKGVVSYEVEPAANVNLVKNGSDRYEFNANGINAYRFTGENIVIGKVVFGGYCDGAKFAVKDLSATTDNTNVVYTTKTANSIVDEYLAGGKLDIASAQINNIKIVEETKDLTVNVTFPNSIENQKADYQKMTVTIVSSDDSYEFNLGATADTATNVIKPDTNGNYQIVQPVVKNRSYTVTVSGDGYRTARYTVNMTADKVVNFWNNVKSQADFVENGMDASKEQVTFLAGELVKDGQINIYDLSAVVSYFGTNNLVDDHPDYARYDLDRNGKIDSRDIAFVLVSWGK